MPVLRDGARGWPGALRRGTSAPGRRALAPAPSAASRTSRNIGGRFGALLLAVGAAACARPAPAPAAQSDITLEHGSEGTNLAAWIELHPHEFDLRIRKDQPGEDYRWYAFRVENAGGRPLTFHITNAASATAPGAWSYNRPAVSSDGGETWRRIPDTRYERGVFTFRHTPASASEWIALSPVYAFDRWLALVQEVTPDSRVSGDVIGRTIENHPLHRLMITDPMGAEPRRPAVWVIARQHPAETGGSWMTEGLVRWLLGGSKQAVALLRAAEFHIVGFMNPDGVLRGNYRVNAAGLDLNRVWDAPDPKTAPTIDATQRAILGFLADSGRIALFADFHAHSTARKNFFFFNDAASTSDALERDILAFAGALERLNPDFTAAGSEPGVVGDGRIAKGWAHLALGAHGITFESSYQDVTYGPFAGEYMSPVRYQALGAAFGRAVAEHFYRIPP